MRVVGLQGMTLVVFVLVLWSLFLVLRHTVFDCYYEHEDDEEDESIVEPQRPSAY